MKPGCCRHLRFLLFMSFSVFSLPFSQFLPWKPALQEHLYPPCSFWHVPPFWHGWFWHSSMSIQEKEKKKFVGLKLLHSPACRKKKKRKEKEKVKVIEKGQIIIKARQTSHASYRFRSVCHHSRLCIYTDSCLDCWCTLLHSCKDYFDIRQYLKLHNIFTFSIH